MNKKIVVGIIALAVLITVGVVEVVFISNQFKDLYDQCRQVLDEIDQQSITVERYDLFLHNWKNLREKGELLLPHADLYEINLRITETRSYVVNQSYKDAEAQLAIVMELLEYVPHLITPDFQHIF